MLTIMPLRISDASPSAVMFGPPLAAGKHELKLELFKEVGEWGAGWRKIC